MVVYPEGTWCCGVTPAGAAEQGYILDTDKCGPQSAALFSLNMLVGTRAGASYSEAECAAWMGAAGLDAIRRVRMPGPAGLMIGTRGAAAQPATEGSNV